jgi:hypothetical protein
MGLKLRLNGVPIDFFDGEIVANRVKAIISHEGDKASKVVNDILRDGAKKIAETAKDMAPYASPEYGGSSNPRKHLQEAIEVKNENTGGGRALKLTVWVNGRRTDDQGRPIGRYAWLMHEGLLPHGEWGGPGFEASPSTLAKGAQAGGKFLERAYREHADKIKRKAEQAARKVFGK